MSPYVPDGDRSCFNRSAVAQSRGEISINEYLNNVLAHLSGIVHPEKGCTKERMLYHPMSMTIQSCVLEPEFTVLEDTHSVETLLLNCWNGNLNDVKLEAPQVLQSLDVHGVARNILETMICIACQRQTYFLLEYCLTLGYDTPGLISKDEPTTPIWNAAIKSPNFDIWKLLIENGLIGHEDQVQQSRLRSLASTGMRADIPHVELLDELFRLGLRISTSLLNIAAQEADQNTMRYLMSKCELRDLEESNALLMAAACNGRLVELLLNSGMNVNADGCESNDPFDFRASTTPLHNAASNGNEESVKLLLERGASKTKRDSQGKTAADVATENGHLRIIVLIHGFEDWVTPRTYPVENQKLYFKFS